MDLLLLTVLLPLLVGTLACFGLGKLTSVHGRALTALAAGGVALALLAGAAYALQAPLAELAASYGAGFALRGFGPLGLATVLGGAAALGWLGAGLVTGHFLRQTRPTDT